jgi:hypothetical protein
MGLPIPEIYMQQIVSSEEKITYAVVDGQQRLRAILQFIGSETDPEEQAHNKFKLDKLDASSDWSNVGFAGLPEDLKKKVLGHRLSVRYLNTDSEDEIREMFRRLNKYLTPLKPQELRNATYSGPFVELTSRYADDEYWAENKIVTAAAIRRMGDVEFISELFIGILHGPQAGSQEVIDSYYEQFEDYEDEFPGQKTTQKLFDETLKLVQQVLPDIKETRWSNKTDFYSLFVAIGQLLRNKKIQLTKAKRMRKALMDFADEVNLRLGDENAKVGQDAVKYVRAVEKGANDKSRRAERNEAVTRLLQEFLTSRRSSQRRED